MKTGLRNTRFGCPQLPRRADRLLARAWLWGLLWGLLWGVLPTAAPAQTLPARHFSLAEGLPETSVSALAQDGHGRLWVVSEVGAAWYDGHEFHSLTTDAGLPNTRVTALGADPGPAAGLWLGLRDGSLCYFDPATERVRRVLPRVEGHPAMILTILAQGTGRRRRVWVGTSNGELYCLRWSAAGKALVASLPPGPPTVQRVLYPTNFAAAPVAINSLALGPGGSLWVATEGGLRLFDEATGQPRPSAALLPPALATGPVLGLSVAADGRLWCGTPAAGLFVVEPPAAGGLIRHYTTAQGLCSDKVLRAVAEPGASGRVWALTGAGLCYLESATTPTARCLPGTGLVSHSYRRGDLLLDREGSLWTTSADGITQYPPDRRFALFNGTDGLPGTKVYALAVAQSQARRGARGEARGYWVGTNDGLALLQPAAPGGARCQVLPRPEPGRPHIVRALLVRANGEVWAGSPQGGTAVWQPTARRWRLLRAEIPVLGETMVSGLAEDARGRVWLATETEGLLVYDPATGFCQHYVGATLAGARRVMKVLRSRAGTMWLGTEKAGLVEALETPPARPGALPALRFRAVSPRPAGAERLSVFSISEGQAGKLWLTSFGEGLFHYDPARSGQGLRRVPLHPEPGAHLDNPYFVQCDALGAVWLGTTRGLLRYAPGRGQQQFFGREEGFIGQETGVNAVLAEPDGTLWAGTVAGLMRYSPWGAHPNRVPPHPRLAGLQLFMRDTVLPAGARLAYHHNHLTFNYSATSLTNPGRVRYQHRLVGFEQAWNSPSAARSATYTNLPPGDYRFELRAANEAGVWSPRPATFAFTIGPPWWRTWWAYGLYALGMALVLYGVRHYTRRQERQRTARQLTEQALTHLRELDRVKTDFFTNISHELRTPLTLIMGPAELLAHDPTDPATRQQAGLVLRNARKLLALINQLLDLSKLEAGAVRLLPTPGDVAATVRKAAAAFAPLAAERGILLRCEGAEQPVPLVFDAARLEEIISNLLANALRFTPAGGHVTLGLAGLPATTTAPAGQVALRVQDSGVGISAAELPHLFERFYQADNAPAGTRTGTGIGLALVRELTELHGGTVAVTSAPGIGTTFVVQLPRALQPLAEAPELPKLPDRPAGTPDQVAVALPEAMAAFSEAVADPEADLVLVVEDNADVREFVRATLAQAGFRVLEAADGPAGLAVALAEVPDLVVSDVMMPGLSGHELCRRLKAAPATSHVPVVLLTAKSDPGARLEGLETGADAYLAKPFDPRELRAQVRNLLALQHRLRAQLALPPPSTIALADPLAAHAAAVAGLPSLDQEFLRRVHESVLEHLNDGDFGVPELGAAVGMGRTQLHRKLKALTGQSPGEAIRVARLNRALALLRAQVATVAEVGYQVGFNSPAHFSTAFSRQFGFPPSATARHGLGASNQHGSDQSG